MAQRLYIDKILLEYEEKRTLAANERRRSIDRVYASVPRIKEIDSEIYRLGNDNIKRILKEPSKSREYNRELKKSLAALTEEKKSLIKENNIDPDYDKYKYSCEICGDTGYREDGKRCECLEKRILREDYLRSNLGQKLKKQNFDTFSFDHYSKEKLNDEISPYENMKRIYNGAKMFCKLFDEDYKNLFFYGGQGLGKTFLSSCIAKELIDKGKDVIYLTASKMCLIYEDYKFGRTEDASAVDDMYGCDLLIIDDLGTEAENKISNSFLFDIFNERLLNERRMIISTNLDINEIDKLYSKRFTSRLFEYFIIYRFTGEDIRYKMLG